MSPSLRLCLSVHQWVSDLLSQDLSPAGVLTAELKPASSKCLFVGVFSSSLVPLAARGVGRVAG